MPNNSKQKYAFQFTIKKKLIVNAFINIGLILIIGLYALNQMKLIGEEVEDIAEIEMPWISSITAIEIHQTRTSTVFTVGMRLVCFFSNAELQRGVVELPYLEIMKYRKPYIPWRYNALAVALNP